jgi:hypothetical protein
MAACLLDSAQVFADGIQVKAESSCVLQTRSSHFLNDRIVHLDSPDCISSGRLRWERPGKTPLLRAWKSAVINDVSYLSPTLSRDFQVSGWRLKCMMATIRITSSLTW